MLTAPLGGCLEVTEPSGAVQVPCPGEPDVDCIGLADEEEVEGSSLKIDLATAVEDGSWRLGAVELLDDGWINASTSFHVLHETPVASPEGSGVEPNAACVALSVGGPLTAMFARPSFAGAEATVAGETVDIRRGALGTHDQRQTLVSAPVQAVAGEKVPILVGFRSASPDWSAVDAGSLRLNVSQPAEFRWLDQGKIHCATAPSDFDEGESVRTTSGVEARDLATRLTTKNHTLGWFLLAADRAYEAEILWNGAVLWSAQGQPATSYERVATPIHAGSGEIEIEVPMLSGSADTSVSYLVLDVPDWAASYLSAENDMRPDASMIQQLPLHSSPPPATPSLARDASL